MDAIGEAAERLAGARRVVVLTGAGVSAESGIPTFRDALTGLWARYDPAELATPEAFARDPALVTRWYDHRRVACAACEPNAGHQALARLERRLGEGAAEFTLLTQNVDRLHARAGSRNVLELHGSLFTWRCSRTGEAVEPGPEPFEEHPPRSRAGAPMRPCVVWFGETLPEGVLEAAFDALGACDLFMAVGTSAVVQPAASFVHVAAQAGAYTIEVNPDPTPATSHVDLAITARAGEALPAIVEAM